ncbi:MAG: DUF433 domain-containing protein, partial [Myxococcota bacterium]
LPVVPDFPAWAVPAKFPGRIRQRAMGTATWREHIHSAPEILGGKPVVRGTRPAVDVLLGLLAEGWSSEQILDNDPQLTPEALRAVFAYASEALHDETFYPVDPGTA